MNGTLASDDRDLPAMRLELRADGAALAWYRPTEMDVAARHARAAAHHPSANALVEVVLTDPSGEVTLVRLGAADASPPSL